MLQTILRAIVSFLVAAQGFLFNPVFAPLPPLNQAVIAESDALTLPVVRDDVPPFPSIQAKAYMVMDLTSGVIFASHNEHEALFPASTTKMMTALVVLEFMDPNKIVTIPAGLTTDGSRMKLVTGERIRVIDLLKGLLIHSSNDAAEALAASFPGGKAVFVQAMNTKALELHMDRTHFENPSGLFHPAHKTTVRDLLLLARAAMHNETFRSIVSQQEASVSNVEGTIKHSLTSTNQLLGVVDGLEGIKTGWTEEAGECLVTQTTRNGHTIITGMLNSPDRFGETRSLIEWVYGAYTWETKPINAW